MRTFEKVRQKEGWDNRQALHRMINAADLQPILALPDEEVELAEFEIDAATFSKILIFDLTLNHRHRWGLFLWMRECYGDLLREEIAAETLYQRERSLEEFNKLMGFEGLDASAARAFQGYFNLYRPYYQDPSERIITQRLVIGSERSLFDCTLTGDYEGHRGRVVSDNFSGKVTPQNTHMFGLLRTPGRYHGSIIIHFDELDVNAGGALINAMKGVMITAIGNSRSSAWPFFAERVDNGAPIPFPIVARADFDKLPAAAVEAMRRGAVHWNPSHYPSGV